MFRRLGFFALALLICFLALITLAWPKVVEHAALAALKASRSASFTPVWSGVRGTWDGVHIDSINALIAVPARASGPIRSLPLRLSIENVWIRPSIVSALLNREALRFSGEIFGGSVSGSLFALLSSPGGTIAWSDINIATLALFPEIRALGLRSGLLEGSIRVGNFGTGGIPSATYSLVVKRFSAPNSSYSSLLKLGPEDVFDLSASGAATADTLTVDTLTVSSNLGRLQARGKARVRGQHELESFEAVTSLELSQQGSEKMGAWLPLLTNGQVASSATSLTIRTKSVPCGNRAGIYNMQFGGQRVCFISIPESVPPSF